MSTTRTKTIYDIATATPAPAKPAEPVNVDFYGGVVCTRNGDHGAQKKREQRFVCLFSGAAINA